MLKSLSLQNFKSWPKISLSLPGITGIFGANSSGKSSIIQSLLLLKQTIESSDRSIPLQFGSERDYVEMGNFTDIIHNHSTNETLAFTFSWDLPKPLIINDPNSPQNDPNSPQNIICQSDEIVFHVSLLSAHEGGSKVLSFQYKLGDMKIDFLQKDDQGNYELSSQGGSHDFRFIRTQGRAWNLPRPFKFHGFPDQAVTYFQNSGFLPDLQHELEEQFARIHYLGPLREPPSRLYKWSGGEPADMGRRGENVIAAILSKGKNKYISTGAHNKCQTLEERIANWLQQLGLIHSFSVSRIAKEANIYEVKVKRTPYSAEVLITDVGFGISQILPVIAICYYVEEGSTILLEQPEIHLHPSVQMGLADVFIDAIKNRNIQIILESHSEHLLSRLQRRMAEGVITQDELSIYFCKSGKSGSHCEQLNLDPAGNISNWPKDFFGDRFGETVAQRKAALQRQTGRAV